MNGLTDTLTCNSTCDDLIESKMYKKRVQKLAVYVLAVFADPVYVVASLARLLKGKRFGFLEKKIIKFLNKFSKRKNTINIYTNELYQIILRKQKNRFI